MGEQLFAVSLINMYADQEKRIRALKLSGQLQKKIESKQKASLTRKQQKKPCQLKKLEFRL